MSENGKLNDELVAVEARRQAGRDEARAEAVARQHALGKLTARERIALLLDEGSFEESGALVEPGRDTFDTENLEAPGDGVITGFGRIEGRPVALCAFDFTIVGGSNGERGEYKVLRIAAQCLQHGYPLIMLLDGGGHRIQEGLDSRHFARGTTLFQAFADLSGWVPIIAAMMGPGFAGPSNFAALADFVVMVDKTSTMGIAGPALVKAATGETIDKEELGGPQIQADQAGIADLSALDDEAALAAIRRYLSYFPSNAEQAPPLLDSEDPVDRREESLLTIVPENIRRAYDMRKIMTAIADEGSIFEIKPTFAKSLYTGFCRMGGRPVGIVANQPMHLGGTLTAAACEKGAHFISLCDAFGIPLLYLIDVPGFMVGPTAERSGLARRGGRLLFELGQATVPRMSVVIRKGYGLAYIAMAGGRSFDADLCVAWPTAEICAMSVEGAVDVAYRKAIAAAADPNAHRDALIERFRSQLGSLRAVEAYGVDDIIDPRDTRKAIITALNRTGLRKSGLARPQRHHAISPI
ncbi:propionyl-CoA carboxylase beta chain [Mesorhizobium sp. J18]|uniref:acyl-CoA carboxylase subunit beta n=1 Tax=Mesorhizobium sp. J18 TaxID=935263 RepID=UPI00119C7F49|nr:acyl-CoA carboxylase subunit beta [Mesorhizobium sp. J18]TWH01177.1 propionyl-CoA carboxylase beta chain [Mesorhizobium sp. J18]